MAAIIELDNSKFCDPTAFITTVVPVIDTAISDAVREYSNKIIDRWRAKSNAGDVTGVFSTKWKKFKSNRGLKTEDLQMHGRGDSRSMYENLIAKEFARGRGWFVGIPLGPVAYDFEGKPRDIELWAVAASLEAGTSPGILGPKLMWSDLLNESPGILAPLLFNSLVTALRTLGAGDAA